MYESRDKDFEKHYNKHYQKKIVEMPPVMNWLKVQYRTCNTYNILETVQFGYRIAVQSEIEPKEYDEGLFIYYDAQKASILINEKGYPFLMIKK